MRPIDIDLLIASLHAGHAEGDRFGPFAVAFAFADLESGSWLLDFHARQLKAAAGVHQGEEQGRESVLADIFAEVAAREAEEKDGHWSAEEAAEDGEDR